LVHFRHWGVNQRGETVFEGERRVLLKKRSFVAEGLAQDESESASATKPRRIQPRRVAPQKLSSAAKTRGAKRARVKTKVARRRKPAVATPRRSPRKR
jgi:hypothetical protein